MVYSMTGYTDCYTELISLALLSLALLISMCINVVFCVKCRASCRDKDDCCSNLDGEGLTQADGRYFHDIDHHEQQENPHNEHEQENPIYGNISIDRRGTVEVCYETMTKQQTRDRVTHLEPDLNYASLDLKVPKKRKKQRRQLGQSQGQNSCQDHQSDFLEVEADMDAHLPSRDTSTMVSHSSIYLNSQQIAQEAEEMERERSTNTESDNVAWEGIRRHEDVGSRKWKGEQRSEEGGDRQDDGDQTVCTQLSEVNDTQSGTDVFDCSFDNNGD